MAWMKIGQNPFLKPTEHKNTKNSNFWFG